jgi:beta-lactamase superfamily II metal-dependent hydrolase
MIFTHPDADHINNTKFLYDNFQINHTYLPLVYANEKISDVDNFTPQIQKKTQTYQTCVTSVLNEPDST